MKPLPAIFLISFGAACTTTAADYPVPSALASATEANSESYFITERGPYHKVWERLEKQTNHLGRVTTRKHSYTELADGMHYKDAAGNWAETKEEITLYPDASGASATNGPHQLYLPADIYQGAIQIVGPDGQVQRNRPMGIAFIQGDKSILIAELTNSVGKLLPTKNQVLYENAFTDFHCDLLVTYRKRGIECDLIFTAKPPSPADFGLSPESCHIQLLTEFFDTTAPAKSNVRLDQESRVADADLAFGTMKMRRGTAFSVGTASSVLPSANQKAGNTKAHSKPVPVRRTWEVLDGRSFLIESVPYNEILPKLAELASVEKPARLIAKQMTPRKAVSSTRTLSSPRIVQKSARQMELASLKSVTQKQGVILDYEELSGSTNSYKFLADTTYYISSTFSVSNAVFEGGTVIKLNNTGEIDVSGSVTCKTGPYRLALLTSKNDNSAGQTVSGSSGSPAFSDVQTFLNITCSNAVLSNLRISHAWAAINDYQYPTSGTSLDLWHCQLADVDIGITATLDHLGLHNVLFNEVYDDQPVYLYSGNAVAENVTSDGYNSMIYTDDPSSQSLALTNCLTTEGTWVAVNGVGGTTLAASPFQTVGGGKYYLAADSPYRNVGTTNITPALLADLRKKTTYPPVLACNVTLQGDSITLSPQAQRDTDQPDLGYHYDSLDYELGWVRATNAFSVTIAPGTAVSTFGTNIFGYGLWLNVSGSHVASQGTADNPIWLTEYNTVQETTPFQWSRVYYSMIGGSPADYRFTYWSSPALDSSYIPQFSGSVNNFKDCQFFGGQLLADDTPMNLTNCLLQRVSSEFGAYGTDFELRNNLFYGGQTYVYAGSDTASVKDNLFDRTDILGSDLTGYDSGYNAFVTNTLSTNFTRLYPTNVHDIILTNTDYRVGPLGNYYYPTNGGMLSQLINTGSTNASLVGLYHYTTTTNLLSGFQVKETNSIVDIGFHYVATDASGIPRDSDSDGIPDYIEDSNGNGTVDSRETDWQSAADLGLKVVITRPRRGGTIP